MKLVGKIINEIKDFNFDYRHHEGEYITSSEVWKDFRYFIEKGGEIYKLNLVAEVDWTGGITSCYIKTNVGVVDSIYDAEICNKNFEDDIIEKVLEGGDLIERNSFEETSTKETALFTIKNEGNIEDLFLILEDKEV